jgi:hypothetical protein
MLSVWKSFHPGNDWPLALCDDRTVNREIDTIASDVVHRDRYMENERIYFNQAHRWFYFKDLGDDEVIVFRQSDTNFNGGGGKMHLLFTKHGLVICLTSDRCCAQRLSQPRC